MNKEEFKILQEKAKEYGIKVYETGRDTLFIKDSYSFRMENMATISDVTGELQAEVVLLDLDIDNSVRSSMEGLLNDLEKYREMEFEEFKPMHTQIQNIQKIGYEYVGKGVHKEQDFIFTYNAPKNDMTIVVPKGGDIHLIDNDREIVDEAIFDGIEKFEQNRGHSYIVEDISDTIPSSNNRNNSRYDIDIDELF